MCQQKWHDDLIVDFLNRFCVYFRHVTSRTEFCRIQNFVFFLKMHFTKNLNILNIGIFMFS